jgi:hypothetical protein
MIFNYKAIDNTGVENAKARSRPSILTWRSTRCSAAGLLFLPSNLPTRGKLSSKNIKFFNHVSATKTSSFCRARCRFCLKLKFRLFEFFDCWDLKPKIHYAKSLGEVADDLQGGSSISKAFKSIRRFFQTFMSTWFVPVKNRESSMKSLATWPIILIEHTK